MAYEIAKAFGVAFGIVSAIGVGLSIVFSNVVMTQDYLNRTKKSIEKSRAYFNSGQIEKAKESIKSAMYNLPKKNFLTKLVEYEVPGTLTTIDNFNKEISELEEKLK